MNYSKLRESLIVSSMRHIRVVAYDPTWVQKFQEEANRLEVIFGEMLLSIHHIGSTSAPGLAAKPVIDMMPVVKEIIRQAQVWRDAQNLKA